MSRDVMRRLKWLLLALMACAMPCCVAGDGVIRPLDVAAAGVLWLPVEAVIQQDHALPAVVRNGRSIYRDGSGAVVFGIDGDRDDVSRRLSQYFASAGWHQRSTDYLNPGTPTSFIGGWTGLRPCIVLFDGGEHAIQRGPYYSWHGQWQNAGGDVVSYRLGGEGRQLAGYAEYVPRRLVDRAVRIASAQARGR